MFFAPVVRHRAVSPAFRSFDRSFERFVSEALINNTHRSAKTDVQLTQDDKAWTLTLDVPGLAREHLSIGIEGNVIRIDSKADAPRQFKAAYELPQDIDAAASAAKLENGVLTLTLGKQVPVSKVVDLAIQ
ncbi:Hsp20/alpha crystallin family protein [Polaromonas sp. P1(28)-13]|nr:Hsp20/alpha crystallin family protein [Polaromonas sp. P1-6]UUZ68662.1 Hsp20/alpha crystallin family protein [Polaromonas sp. P2-4]UUZ76438.1 Hsp20/alpha crystallin family protein [Polaromonas sp. P1(28)-13]